MTKVVLGMSMSIDGIAGPHAPDEDGMKVFNAILGWVFPLRSWREQQGQEGGADSVDSRVWAENFERFGPQIVGRTMFTYGYDSWGGRPAVPCAGVRGHAPWPGADREGRRHQLYVRDGRGRCRREGGPRGRGWQGRAAGRRGQHRAAGAGRWAGRRGRTPRVAGRAGPRQAAVRVEPGGPALHRDDRWRGGRSPALRGQVSLAA